MPPTPTWLEIVKTSVPPAITGLVGIFAVLLTQGLQRANDRSKRLDDRKRESLRARADALAELLARLFEAEAIQMFCVGNKLLANGTLEDLKKLGERTADIDPVFEALLKSLEDRHAVGREMFNDLNRVCSAAMAAAERSGTLPDDLSIEGSTDLVATVNKWRFSNLLEADHPNRHEEVKELAVRLQKQIVGKCREQRSRLQQEIEAI